MVMVVRPPLTTYNPCLSDTGGHAPHYREDTCHDVTERRDCHVINIPYINIDPFGPWHCSAFQTSGNVLISWRCQSSSGDRNHRNLRQSDPSLICIQIYTIILYLFNYLQIIYLNPLRRFRDNLRVIICDDWVENAKERQNTSTFNKRHMSGMLWIDGEPGGLEHHHQEE